MATFFYINLGRSTDRNQFMQSQFESLGINARRISAVDGFELPENEIRKAFGTNLIDKQLLPLGALGCFLSHYKVYQIMEAENIPVAVIMEDDLKIKEPKPQKIISEIENLQESWNIVHMAGVPNNNGGEPVFTQWSSRKQLSDDYFLSRFAWIKFSTGCYMIKRNYACRLLEEYRKLGGFFSCPIDHWLFDLAFAASWPHLLYKLNPDNKYLPHQPFGVPKRFSSTRRHPVQRLKKATPVKTFKIAPPGSPKPSGKLIQKRIMYILFGLLPHSDRDLPSQREPESYYMRYDKAGKFSSNQFYKIKSSRTMKVKIILNMILRIFRSG